MTRIGPKLFGSLNRPPRPEAECAAASPSRQPNKDLVDLNTGQTTYALKKASLNAAEFFLKNALPLAGAALAGPAGLIAGAVVSGVIEYLDRPGESTEHRILGAAQKALLTSAAAAGLGLTGALSPLLQIGVAATGTLAAGVLEFGAQKSEKKAEVNSGKLASEYQKRAQTVLNEAGHPDVLKNLGGGFSLSKEARKLRSQVRLVQTALIVKHHLGPGVAVALAGDIGRERINSALLSEQVDNFYRDQSVSEHRIEEATIRRIEGLAERDRSMGSALYDLILLDSQYHPDSGDPKTDFIVGHEMSHVRWRDSSATLALEALKQAVSSVYRSSGSPHERELLVDLANDLEQAQLADSRRMENRADQEGLKYALRRGHSGPELLRSAAEIFGEEDSPDVYQQHPNGAKRMAAIRRTLESEST